MNEKEPILEVPELLERAGFKRDSKRVKIIFEAAKLSREICKRGREKNV